MKNSILFASVRDSFPYQIKVFEEQTLLIKEITDFLENYLLSRLLESFPKPLGLATGRTMEPIYRALINRLKSWPKVQLEELLKNWCSFNLDEYVGLGIDDYESFLSYMKRFLVDPLDLSPEKFHIPNGNTEDPDKAAFRYLEELQECGGLGIQLLGLGGNGHIGFNEPPCNNKDSCRVVSLSSSTRKQNAFSFGGDLNKVPSKAITLGLAEILNADEIHLVVTGKEKMFILKELLSSDCTENLPASWLKLHSRVFLWVDKDAYAKC